MSPSFSEDVILHSMSQFLSWKWRIERTTYCMYEFEDLLLLLFFSPNEYYHVLQSTGSLVHTYIRSTPLHLLSPGLICKSYNLGREMTEAYGDCT